MQVTIDKPQDFLQYNKDDFEKLHTKQLLGILNQTRRWNITTLGSSDLLKKVVSHRDVLKSVLETRPHVPNKQEARAIRQKSAKARVRSLT